MEQWALLLAGGIGTVLTGLVAALWVRQERAHEKLEAQHQALRESTTATLHRLELETQRCMTRADMEVALTRIETSMARQIEEVKAALRGIQAERRHGGSEP